MRQKIELGLTPGDNRGDTLRAAFTKIEMAFREIYTFLSGNVSQVELPDAIPIESGGTGQPTMSGFEDYVRFLGYKHFQANCVVGTVVGYFVISSTEVKFVNLVELDLNPFIVKQSEGVYTLSNIGNLVIDRNASALPQNWDNSSPYSVSFVYGNDGVVTANVVSSYPGNVIADTDILVFGLVNKTTAPI